LIRLSEVSTAPPLEWTRPSSICAWPHFSHTAAPETADLLMCGVMWLISRLCRHERQNPGVPQRTDQAEHEQVRGFKSATHHHRETRSQFHKV